MAYIPMLEAEFRRISPVSSYADDCDVVAVIHPAKLCRRQVAGCCTGARSRCKCFLFAFVICMSAVSLVILFLPSYLLAQRLKEAHIISLETASVLIDNVTASMLRPKARISAPKSLLKVPMMSYSATIHPFDASIFIAVKSTKRELKKFGVLRVSDEFHVSSSSDVNATVSGDFQITGAQYMGQLVNSFLVKDIVNATIKATVSCSVKAWGWLPVYIPLIFMDFTQPIPAFNNFKVHLPQLGEIAHADGQPTKLTIGCTISIYNPSPLSVIIQDQLRLRVVYTYLHKNFTVGVASVSEIQMSPGMNVVRAMMVVHQNAGNSDAITELITAYMGGIQKGFEPAGTKPFRLALQDDGNTSARSEFMRTALHGLDMSLDIRPKPLYCIKSITVDVTIGGSIIHWPPALYTAVVHIAVSNPLPTPVRIEKISVSVFMKNLSGPRLYRFRRHNLNPDTYAIPGNQTAMLSFSLYIDEVVPPSPEEWHELVRLAHMAFNRNVTVGVQAELDLIMDPAYRQHVNYTNNAISSVLCYHVKDPASICGSASAQLPAGSHHSRSRSF